MEPLSKRMQSGWLEPRDWPDGSGAISAMDRLFNRFDGMYPGRWRSSFSSAEAVDNWRREWASAFEAEGLTTEDVRFGLQELKKIYAWPPSITEFLLVCRPATQPDVAFHLAADEMANRRNFKPENWPSARMYWAAAAMGEAMMLPYQQVKSRWLVEWRRAAQREHEPIPQVLPERALPAPGRIYPSATEVHQRVGRLTDSLAGLSVSGAYVERARQRLAVGGLGLDAREKLQRIVDLHDRKRAA